MTDSESKEPDPNTLYGKFLISKRELIGNIHLGDITKAVADSGGWDNGDGALLKQSFTDLSIPFRQLAASINDQSSYDQCMQNLGKLNEDLRSFMQKHGPKT